MFCSVLFVLCINLIYVIGLSMITTESIFEGKHPLNQIKKFELHISLNFFNEWGFYIAKILVDRIMSINFLQKYVEEVRLSFH
jgi:hypothetical protein